MTVRSRVDGQLLDVGLREGQLVQKGDLLARIDPRPFEVQLAQAEGQLAKDEAALRDARIDLQRYQALLAKDAIPKQQLDTQVAAVDQLVGALESDRSQIDSAKLNLTYCRITAPITGRVGLRLVDPGNIVHAADQNGLFVITQVQPVAVIFYDSRRQPADGSGAGAQRPSPRRRRLQPRADHAARHRLAADPRQSDRPDHRHHQAESELPRTPTARCSRISS